MFTTPQVSSSSSQASAGFSTTSSSSSHPSFTFDTLVGILLVVNVCVGLASGWLYFHKASLKKELATQKVELDGFLKDLEAKGIPLAEMANASTRVSSMSALFDSAPYSRGVMPLVGQMMLRTANITSSVNATYSDKDGGYRVVFNAVVPGLEAMIRQRDIYQANVLSKYVREPNIVVGVHDKAKNTIAFGSTMTFLLKGVKEEEFLIDTQSAGVTETRSQTFLPRGTTTQSLVPLATSTQATSTASSSTR